MKKRLSVLLIAGLLLTLLAGCGATTEKTDNGMTINTKYSEETMTTVTGKEVDIANTSFALGATAYGFAMTYPEDWKAIEQHNLYLVRDENVCMASYVPQAVVDKLSAMADSDMSDEEIAQANALLSDALIPFAALYALDEESKEKPSVLEDYRESETIATANGYVYELAYNTEFHRDGLADVDQANLDILVKSVDTLVENVLLFPPQKAKEAGFEGSLEAFEAKDMEGNAVDQSIFAEYDLTMVNVWTTWCGPCVGEMGALQALYQDLPENVNMISICADAADEKELTEEILKENQVTFKTLVPNEALYDAFLAHVSGFPTTVFVDKDGHIVGAPQLGVPGNDPASAYKALIEERLGMLENDGGDAAWLKEEEKR